MPIRFYLRLLLIALLAIPVVALLVIGPDVALANLLHEHSAPLKPFFTSFMHWWDVLIYNSFVLWMWAGLFGLFVVARLLRWPNSTIWLVTLLTSISSQGVVNLLKVYFNRPRPAAVLDHLAPDAGFWQAVGRFDSFPSAHAAITAGLLLPWALRFPKARP